MKASFLPLQAEFLQCSPEKDVGWEPSPRDARLQAKLASWAYTCVVIQGPGFRGPCVWFTEHCALS